MERRLAITYALSATGILCTACVAVATVAGGLFASAAPNTNGGVRTIENVDDYIVVHSATTAPAVDPASEAIRAELVAPPAPDTTVATTAAPARVVTPAQVPASQAPRSTSAASAAPEVSENPDTTTREAPDTTAARSRERRDDDSHEDDEHEHEDGEHETDD